jgi:hypothetical protein
VSGKWVNNHGQAVQVICAAGSFLLGLVLAWPTIQAHQNVLAWWPAVILPIAMLVAFRLGSSSSPTVEGAIDLNGPAVSTSVTLKDAPTTRVSRPLLPTYTERFALDSDSISTGKKLVKLGDFWDTEDRLKISPLRFHALERNKTGVEIRFDTHGSLFFGGEETKKAGTNHIILPQTTSGFQAEPFCAYQYSFSDKHVHFKVVRVDHINEVANEVLLEFCFISLRKLPREDSV